MGSLYASERASRNLVRVASIGSVALALTLVLTACDQGSRNSTSSPTQSVVPSPATLQYSTHTRASLPATNDSEPRNEEPPLSAVPNGTSNRCLYPGDHKCRYDTPESPSGSSQ
jgi:hypothetical protein